jgi:hypothetical protein
LRVEHYNDKELKSDVLPAGQIIALTLKLYGNPRKGKTQKMVDRAQIIWLGSHRYA